MNRLLIIINKQLNNNPNSPTIPFFPTKTHHSPPCWGGAGGEAFPLLSPKVTLLPSLRGRGRGRGFSPSFPQNHITPLPTGEGQGERL